jgi:hypothetical protein
MDLSKIIIGQTHRNTMETWQSCWHHVKSREIEREGHQVQARDQFPSIALALVAEVGGESQCTDMQSRALV